MKIDLNELRRTTKEAIAEGQRRHEDKLRQEALAAERKQREAEFKAEGVIGRLPGKCQSAAEEGRSFAVIMDLTHDKDYSYAQSAGGSIILRGAGQIVWDYCSNEGLKPTIEQWHDGVGINGGYQIVVHWSE